MRLPIFPLHAVLFPHLPLPLHVFEPRYRAMTADLLAGDGPWNGRFVVALLRDGAEVGGEGSEPVRVADVGTLAEVRRADQFPDGRYALLAVGVARVTLGAMDRSGAYAVVEATELEDVPGSGADLLLPRVQAALDAYLDGVKRFVASAASSGQPPMEDRQRVTASLDEVLRPIHLPDDPVAASYAVAGVLQVDLAHKQELLELPDGARRLAEELETLRRETRLLADGVLPPVAAEIRYHPN